MRRHRRSALVSALGLAAGLSTGCSGGSAPPAPAPTASGPVVDSLQQAVSAMTSLRSYGFRLDATVTQGQAAQHLGATGRVVNPDRIAALLSINGQREQVVGTPDGQFQMVAAAPGKPAAPWQRAQGSSVQPIPWPTVLGDLQQPTLGGPPVGTQSGSTVTGTVPLEDAVAFGFPNTATISSSRALVTLDAAHRVTRLDLTLAGRDGQGTVTVREVVALDGFDQQAAVTDPTVG